jgi:hypothetical protein
MRTFGRRIAYVVTHPGTFTLREKSGCGVTTLLCHRLVDQLVCFFASGFKKAMCRQIVDPQS